jgi:hypothetical protein
MFCPGPAVPCEPMFYRSKEHLKAQLEERLRTALEFATLGAYEPDSVAHPEVPREPQARVFLFAKVSPPCPHSPAPASGCDAAGAEATEHRGALASGSLVGTRRRIRRARRGGTVKVAPQPCTWAGGHRS